jgi:hypothetical protein
MAASAPTCLPILSPSFPVPPHAPLPPECSAPLLPRRATPVILPLPPLTRLPLSLRLVVNLTLLCCHTDELFDLEGKVCRRMQESGAEGEG